MARMAQLGLYGAGFSPLRDGATEGSQAEVDGMNCARPSAPTGERASSFHRLSVCICAAKTDTGASIPHTARAVRMSGERYSSAVRGTLSAP